MNLDRSTAAQPLGQPMPAGHAGAGRTPRRLWPTRQERKSLAMGLLFISPWLIGFLAFLVYPIYYTLRISFTRYSGFGEPTWIGIENYRRMLDDEVFRVSLWNTLYYTGLAVPIGAVIAMVLALAMNQPLGEIPIYRMILYLPSVLPLFAISFIFIALLDPTQGILNEALRLIGISPPNWFGDPRYAKIAIVAIAQFGAGQIALIFLAGLKGIPNHLYEAAMLDGAGAWSRFLNVTLPLMTPVILYDIILGVSQGLQVFTESYIITQGGPANSTTFYVYYLYSNAFRYGGQMGYAAAMAWVLFVITFIIAIIIFRTSSRWVHYELT
ncbi:MAG: sugar ABC transporter permease [Chloroflexota bacterium]|nr:sugar ABC transporter permease [Chloroflexota bacterium]